MEEEEIESAPRTEGMTAELPIETQKFKGTDGRKCSFPRMQIAPLIPLPVTDGYLSFFVPPAESAAAAPFPLYLLFAMLIRRLFFAAVD